jgi:hypothetical protein
VETVFDPNSTPTVGTWSVEKLFSVYWDKMQVLPTTKNDKKNFNIKFSF